VELVIVMAVVALVAVFVTVPLRREQVGTRLARAEQEVALQAIEELEAAREAKYREIRDAELDHATGKLSTRDFASVDAALRAEAVQILKALDDARERLRRVGAADAPAPGVDADSAGEARGAASAPRRLPSRSR
jgi:type II secretory pathway pseudopilin PulG